MNILAIETSCDETSAAIVKDGREVLAMVVYSQIATHAKTGGVVPEVAAREHVVKILPVIQEVFDLSRLAVRDIHALAVTAGPGLVTSLMIGVDTVRTLAYMWNKKLIPVNHLDGHLAAAGITRVVQGESEIIVPVREVFPRVALLVSGGHTQLFIEKKRGERMMLGQTLDDAAGEAFDKAASVLDLPYPGGPSLSKLAEIGDDQRFAFPRPMSHADNYLFSYSGLKTALIDKVREVLPRVKKEQREKLRADLAASFQLAVVDSLYRKTAKAVQHFGAKQVVIAGGVAANKKLRDYFLENFAEQGVSVLVPPPMLCTDNAAMIGAEAYRLWKKKILIDPRKLEANPSYQKD